MVRVRLLPILVAALAALPLSGCLEDSPRGGGLLLTSGLFPFEAIQRGEPGAVPVEDCASLADVLRERALRQARVALDQGVREDYGRDWFRGFGFGGDAVMAMEDSSASTPEAGMASGASSTGAQVTGTNNQEQAADEADLVKTDGEWTYVLSNGMLHILQSRTVGSLREHGTMSFGQAWGGELILERRDPDDPKDDRLLVILPGQQMPQDEPLAQGVDGNAGVSADAMYWGGWGGMTRVLVLSLADRAHPTIEHEAWVEGTHSGTRLIDGVAHIVVQTMEEVLGLRTWVGPDEGDLAVLNLTYSQYGALSDDARRAVREQVALRIDAENEALLESIDLDSHLPTVMGRHFGFLIPEPVSEDTCREVLSVPQATGRAFTTVLSIGITDPHLPSKTVQVLGGSAIVYGDSGALVLASPSQDTWWFWAQPQLEEATDLLWFDLHGLDVTLRASGRVLGTVIDSFALDVHDDELRVATTLGSWSRWWLADPVPMTSQMVVLEEEAGLLVPTGSVGGIAPGEFLWSVRFTDDRAYLVTFRQTDPLWVIDLASPVPRILGELHVAGVSTYIHPIGDDLLLTIGYGAGPDGLNLDESQIVVSLFDVSDPTDPKRTDFLNLAPSQGWGWSSAIREHRAFTYWEAIGTLAVPMSSSRAYEVQRNGYSEWVQQNHVGLSLVTVDRDAKTLALRGEVDQDALASQQAYGYYGGQGIERSWFLGYPETGPVSVYAMSALGVTSNDLDTLQRQATVAFPPSEPVYY